MKKNIITISRQFGSGGRTVGKMLAERLGVPFYDKELVKQVADETGFDAAFIEENGEFSPSKSIFSFAMSQGIPCMQNGLSMSDFIFCVQRQVILKLAEKPCVIVGRGADYILRDHPGLVSVFVHADKDFRAARVAEEYKLPDAKVRDMLVKTDKKRANYYNFQSEKQWGAATSYNLCIESSALGIDNSVELIMEYIKHKRGRLD